MAHHGPVQPLLLTEVPDLPQACSPQTLPARTSRSGRARPGIPQHTGGIYISSPVSIFIINISQNRENIQVNVDAFSV